MLKFLVCFNFVLSFSTFVSAKTLKVSGFTHEVSNTEIDENYFLINKIGTDEAGLFYTLTLKISDELISNNKKNRLNIEEIESASSLFDFCSNPGTKDVVETIYIKAGKFVACRSIHTIPEDKSFEFTTWYIQGFWLPVKSIMKMPNGHLQIRELTELITVQ